MEKLMRNAPTLAVFVAMFIQVPRVSAFGESIGAGVFAPIFAIFLGMSIYVLAYWHGRSEYHITASEEEKSKYTQQKRMKKLYDEIRSLVGFWLTLFVVIEGLLNLAETLTHLKSDILIFSWQWFGAFTYGIFPTLAALGMGAIQAKLHRIPHGVANASWIEVMFSAFAKRIASYMDEQPAQPANSASQTTQPASQTAKPNRNSDAYPRPCPNGCGYISQTAGQYSTHFRYCPKKNAKVAPVGRFLITASEDGKDKTVGSENTPHSPIQ